MTSLYDMTVTDSSLQEELLIKKEDPLEWYKTKVGKLHELLSDPHPGLLSWCKFFSDGMNELTEKWTEYDR